MKKIIKRVLYVFAGIIIILLLAAGGFYWKFTSEVKGMSQANTQKINDSVYCIKDKFVNAYLFKGTAGWLMIDAGVGEDSFLPELKSLGLTPEQVTTILLTHTDGDHIGAVGAFKNAKVMMHKDEVQMVDGTNGKFFFMKSKWSYGPYSVFNSNDTLHIDGLEVKVLHTPGHSPGSCCFLVNGKYLEAGDNVSYKNGIFSTFNNFFNMNTEVQKAEIEKLTELKTTQYILTAHYGIVKNF